jgi:hypothetical protein
MSPADLVWWGPMVRAVAAAIFALYFYRYGSRDSVKQEGKSGLPLLLAALAGIAAFTSGLAGVMRFVHWFWGN